MENNPKINKDSLEAGFVFVPYITKNVKTVINNETVWYAGLADY